MKQKNFLVTIIAAIFVAVVALVWINNHYKTTVPPLVHPLTHNPAPAQRYVQSDLPPKTLPYGISADLPIDSGAKVLLNQTILDSQTNLNESVYSYVTTKSIAANFTAYQKYVASKKWKVGSTKDESDYKQIIANTGDGAMNIVLDYHSSSSTPTVTLYFVYKLSPTKVPPGV